MITPVLRPAECRVLWADPRYQPISALTGVLTDSERARAARYHREADRRRFITACALLRTSAAAQLGIADPENVPIDRSCDECGKSHGKPRILDTPLEVSISHSGDRIAVALSLAGPVGVDVEEVAEAPGGVPEFALSPAELATLRTLPESAQETGFIQMWVRKEAVLKATGHGLRIPPDQVEVSGPWDEPRLLNWPLPASPSTVQFHRLDPGDGYLGVVAVLADGRPVTVSETMIASVHHNDFSSLARNAA
jgi:4'-phosphopantetheinyl transferase